MVILLNGARILALLAVYTAAIFGIVLIMKICRLPQRWHIFTACMVFGILAGTMVLLYSHYDSSSLFNLPAVYAGQAVYGLSINLFGDPHSSQAHYTICLLYTSDAADELDGVDLGGRRIIKKIFFKQKTAY